MDIIGGHPGKRSGQWVAALLGRTEHAVATRGGATGLGTIERVVEETPADTLRRNFRRELTAAMKGRRSVEVAALRAAIASVDNAEAVDLASVRTGGKKRDPEVRIAGAVSGAGAGDVRRRALSWADLQRILDEELTGLHERAADYEGLGRDAEAAVVRAQADVMARLRAAVGPEQS